MTPAADPLQAIAAELAAINRTLQAIVVLLTALAGPSRPVAMRRAY